MDFKAASHEDLVTLFKNSVIRYKKEPVYVKDVPDRGTLIVHPLDGGKGKASYVDISDLELDFEPVPLGFVNHNKIAFFMSRTPSRQWCQGLSPKNVVTEAISKRRDAVVGDARALSQLTTKSLVSCIKGEYPKLDRALELLEEKHESVAISRYFAIDQDFSIFHRTQEVGLLDKGANVVFKRAYSYLEEVFYA